MPPRLQVLRAATSVLFAPKSTSVTPLLAPFLLPAQQRAASILSSLSDTPGAYHKRIRLGRGPASGKGKTSGRGQKGQKAHGTGPPRDFNGGQTKEEITNPPRGRNKYNPFKVEQSPINLDRIQSWIDQGRIDPSKPITMKELNDSRCLHGVKKDGVKLLARNADTLKTAIHIIVSRASASAIAKVEALGGTVTTRFYSPPAIRRILSGQTHPTISLQSPPKLIALSLPTLTSTSTAASDASKVLTALTDASSPQQAKDRAVESIMNQVLAKYAYRLPDATSRKDIEYYRDPAHRGYLSYLVKEGESPSLFFKVPRTANMKVVRKGDVKRKATKASAENKLW